MVKRIVQLSDEERGRSVLEFVSEQTKERAEDIYHAPKRAINAVTGGVADSIAFTLKDTGAGIKESAGELKNAALQPVIRMVALPAKELFTGHPFRATAQVVHGAASTYKHSSRAVENLIEIPFRIGENLVDNAARISAGIVGQDITDDSYKGSNLDIKPSPWDYGGTGNKVTRLFDVKTAANNNKHFKSDKKAEKKKAA